MCAKLRHQQALLIGSYRTKGIGINILLHYPHNPRFMSTMSETTQLTLHTFFRSTSSGRLRIALNLKGLTYTPIYVNLFEKEHESPEYTKLNPSRTVPLLVHGDISIGQSLAALEYLEEAFPNSRPLLPPKDDFAGRAFVRAIADVVVADIQPVTALRLLSGIESIGGDRLAWAKEWTERGLRVVEGMLAQRAEENEGKFCYGDEVTMADVCLTSALWNAKVYGASLDEFPRVKTVFEAMSKLEEVKRAEPAAQEDAPRDAK